nr:DUF3887 domain-containing protein [Pedobacter panaciterrae]
MKKIFLLIFALFVTTSAFSQGVLNLLGRSQDFFKLLEDQKYPEAYGYLDSTFQAKVPEEDLQKIWTQISEKLGKIETLDVVSSKTQGDFFVVTMEGKFTNDEQNFLLAFNKAEKIVGFFVQPKSTAPTYKLPVYADTTLYKETEINVKTPGHSLVGILTAPKKLASYPVVVLVHGSGPADMDETVGPNKPLKDIAVGLASKGIASIRYVKRTMIYGGEFGKAFTVKEEVLDDAVAAIALARTLKEVNKKEIYLLGHDLGGMVAPRIAALAPDLNGIIMLAAPARKFTDLLVEQNKYMFALAKDTTETGKKTLDTVIKELDVTRITKLGTMKPDSVLLGLPASYWIDLNLNDQVAAAKKLVKQRIFVGQGGNDFQVSTVDYNLWNTAIGKKKGSMVKLYPELNHLLSPQTEKGSMEQYRTPVNVSDVLITDIASWIKTK